MKKVCIFLFSGTGMTRYVVDKITHELENLQVKVDVYPIEKLRFKVFPSTHMMRWALLILYMLLTLPKLL